MDVRKLSRGDAVIGVAAVLIFIFSFFNYIKSTRSDEGVNAWSSHLAPTVFVVVLTPIIAAALFILGGLLPQLRDKPILGLTARQWALPLTILAPISALWSIAQADSDLGIEMGIGGIFLILLVIVLVVTMIATTVMPALQAPLLGAAGPAAGPQGQYGGPQGQQQYGGAPFGGPQGPQGPQSYGGAPQQGGFGGPAPQGPQGGFGAPGPQGPQGPGGMQQPAPGGAPGGTHAPFQPFWFSVPDSRPMLDEHTNQEKGVLNTGVWYLAVAEHPNGLLVEVDNVRGVLQNTIGIQRS
ncbi:hypothetical protein [Embleya sp. NPDC005575]|uniref:hypothetical protein n=1 Tax=Embleya sp. NPDC005575 TaxID=3156892 RepID=UPI00339FA325